MTNFWLTFLNALFAGFNTGAFVLWGSAFNLGVAVFCGLTAIILAVRES